MVCNDMAKTEHECKDGSEKDVHKGETPPVAKVSGPRSSMSAPRQSKTSGATSRSSRSSAAQSVRGTYVKSKSGFSKYRHHPSPSSTSASKLAIQPSSCVTKKVVDSELSSPKVLSTSDELLAHSCRHTAVDDTAVFFSQLFPGSFMSYESVTFTFVMSHWLGHRALSIASCLSVCPSVPCTANYKDQVSTACRLWFVFCNYKFSFMPVLSEFFYPVLVFKVLRLSLKPG